MKFQVKGLSNFDLLWRKMITKQIDDHSIAIIAQEPDDLLTVRRTIKNGDQIVGDSTRVIKPEKELFLWQAEPLLTLPYCLFQTVI